MRVYLSAVYLCVTSLLLAGCSTLYRSSRPSVHPDRGASATSILVQAGYFPTDQDEQVLPPPQKVEQKSIITTEAVGLSDLIALTLERNPRIAEVSLAIETARGRAIQAGLYPNPTVNFTGNELGDRTGPVGILSVYTTQEIVTADKLNLSQSAIFKEVDQATLNLIAERYQVFTEVRQAFFEALTLQKRARILVDSVKLAEESVERAGKLLEVKEAARLDVVQLEVELERYRAELEATQKALPASYLRLAASIGVQDMSIGKLLGDLDFPLAEYDLDQARLYMLNIHPELRAAQIGVERAQLVLERAKVEPIPNITIGAGYTYQGQNRSNDGDVGISFPLPLWNKNQGNILAAQSGVSKAIQHVERVRNKLVNQLATAFATYISARKRLERYRSTILPKAQETFQLSKKAYQGGRFEYLQVLQAQRTVTEVNLQVVRSLGEMWQAVSEIAGLMVEDKWPIAPANTIQKRK